jgi:serine/threonine protein kinase
MSTAPESDPIPLRVGPDDDRDRYALRRFMRSGSEGQVWEAFRPDELDSSGHAARKYAVKLLKPTRHLEAVTDLGERWMRSFEVLQATQPIDGVAFAYGCFPCDHKHLPGESAEGRTWCLVMAWVPGFSYDQHLKSHPRDLRPLAQVARGLDALHRLQPPHAHGDVKPANIKVPQEEHEEPAGVLVDLGLLRQITNDPPTTAIITPAYVDPSLHLNGYSRLSDLYSFAATLHFALMSSPPDPKDRAWQDQLREVASGTGVERIIGALDPDPDQRQRRAAYVPGQLADWFGEVVKDLPMVSEKTKRSVAETIVQPPVRIDPPEPPLPPVQRFSSEILLELLDNGQFAMLVVFAVVAGFVVGLVLGS